MKLVVPSWFTAPPNAGRPTLLWWPERKQQQQQLERTVAAAETDEADGDRAETETGARRRKSWKGDGGENGSGLAEEKEGFRRETRTEKKVCAQRKRNVRAEFVCCFFIFFFVKTYEILVQK